MAAPEVLLAVQQLNTVLSAINGAPNFTHSIETVENQGRLWAQVADAERPYIGIQLMGATVTNAMARQVFQDCDVRLVCHLPFAADPDARLTAQQELVDDIYTAIDRGAGGRTLNRNCISSDIIRWSVDASDPLSVHTLFVLMTMRIRRSPGAS